MAKIIMDNQSFLSDIFALKLVSKVIDMGRISNQGTQYCYVTSFIVDNREVMVATSLNPKSDRFVVYDEPADRAVIYNGL